MSRLFVMIGLGLMAAMPAWAQGRPDPTDPRVAVAPPAYRSAYDGYQRFALPKRVPWRDANAAVARTGGHAGALKGKDGDEVPQAAPLTPVEGGHAH